MDMVFLFCLQDLANPYAYVLLFKASGRTSYSIEAFILLTQYHLYVLLQQCHFTGELAISLSRMWIDGIPLALIQPPDLSSVLQGVTQPIPCSFLNFWQLIKDKVAKECGILSLKVPGPFMSR